jgi:hypothetical protein
MNEHRGEEALPAGNRPAKEARRSAAPGDWNHPANWVPLEGTERAAPASSGEAVIFSAPKDPPESKQR